jgi:hypothetical protein
MNPPTLQACLTPKPTSGTSYRRDGTSGKYPLEDWRFYPGSFLEGVPSFVRRAFEAARADVEKYGSFGPSRCAPGDREVRDYLAGLPKSRPRAVVLAELKVLLEKEPAPDLPNVVSNGLEFPYDVITGAAGRFTWIYADYLEPSSVLYLAYLTAQGRWSSAPTLNSASSPSRDSSRSSWRSQVAENVRSKNVTDFQDRETSLAGAAVDRRSSRWLSPRSRSSCWTSMR